MKKVLILAYDFPPYVSVGGLRPYAWYKYLNNYGIYPIVITRQWSNAYGNKLDYIAAGQSNADIIEKTEFGTIIRTPYKPNLSNRLLLKYGEKKFMLVRKSISAYYEIIQWFFLCGNKAEIDKSANNYLKYNNVDAIIATGDPFILFKYASKLSKTYNIPWIADYRDPWTLNINTKKTPFLRFFYKYHERKLVTTAQKITTVSSFVQHQISSVVKQKPFEIIPNGYDSEAIESITNKNEQNEFLTFSLAGTIYKWHPIRSFLKVLSEFITENSNAKIRIIFYGINNANDIRNLLDSNFPKIRENVIITPRIPNSELLKRVTKNNIMLLFNDYSYMGTKIYDYLGLKRKILMCYSNDPEALELKQKYFKLEEIEDESKTLQEDLIKATNSGIVAKDALHLKEILYLLYSEFEKNGFIACDSQNTEQYSRKLQTKKLAEIIKDITN